MRRLVLCGLLALIPATATAQSSSSGKTMRDVIRNLFHFGTCPQLICLDSLTGIHGNHFNPDALTSGQELIDFLSSAITTSVGTIPIGSTSNATTFSFDANGAPIAAAGSGGPIFAERAQTLGRGHLFFGVGVTGLHYDAIRGIPLSRLSLTLTHENEQPLDGGLLGNPSFEYDRIAISTTMHVNLTAYTAFMTYGIGNKLDIGLALPLIHLSIDGRSIGTIIQATPTVYHYWKGSQADPQLVDTATSSGSTTGIGDLAIRAKLNMYQSSAIGVAVLGDVRLPTGDEANLLGAGSVSARAIGIVSARAGPIFPHINAGYLFRGGSNTNDAILTTVGFDALVIPHLTVAAEANGQIQLGASNVALPPPAHFLDGSVVPRTNFPDQRDDVYEASFGAKLSVGGGLTEVGNVIIPLGNRGVTSNLIWTVGLEKNF